ncbi:MAG: CoA-binding protein [Candidatus Paceibacterota bacterium]|jgi:acetyltransferase|nr:CoA-binding protein [Candidatus Paceibacterota bacterium]MDD5555228.1 CoA-binding protein [Candidatus Paceibacterota bacterium]
MNLDKIFNPASVAVIGASEEEKTVGAGLVKNLMSDRRKIYCVNPFREKVFQMDCFKKITDIKEKIDLAVIAVPDKVVLEVVEECCQKKVQGIIVVSSGFRESGEEGRQREDKLRELVEKAGIPLVGPNCLGIINLNSGLNASFAPLTPQKGDIAFLSQSGSLANALIDRSIDLNLGFSKIVSYGNEAQVDLTQLLSYLRDDKETKVILLYLEGVKKGREFFETAKEISQHKPIVVLKAGRSKMGEKAVSTHTGSMVGDYETYQAVFKQAGLVEVDSLEELLDAGKALSFEKKCRNGIGIVTNGGGLGVLAVDFCEKLGVEVSELKKETIDKLEKDKRMEKVLIKRNPLDIMGDALSERYEAAIRALLEAKEINGLLVIQSVQMMTEPLKNAKIITELKKEFPLKPVICCFVGGPLIKEAAGYLEENKTPNYPDPKRAVKAVKNLIV